MKGLFDFQERSKLYNPSLEKKNWSQGGGGFDPLRTRLMCSNFAESRTTKNNAFGVPPFNFSNAHENEVASNIDLNYLVEVVLLY